MISSHLHFNSMKIPGISIGDKVTGVPLRLLWFVNYFIIEGNVTLWLKQGSPPRWPVLSRNQAAQQEVTCGRANEASSAAPHGSPSLPLLPEPSPALPAPQGKTVFQLSLVPGVKKVGDCWVRG